MAENDQRCIERSGTTDRVATSRRSRPTGRPGGRHGAAGTGSGTTFTVTDPSVPPASSASRSATADSAGIVQVPVANSAGSIVPSPARANRNALMAGLLIPRALAHQTAVWCWARVRAT